MRLLRLRSLAALAVLALASSAARRRRSSPTAAKRRPQRTASIPSASARRRRTPPIGAFQRGLYMTALNLALPRAEAGDPAAQTLVAEILSRGLGARATRRRRPNGTSAPPNRACPRRSSSMR